MLNPAFVELALEYKGEVKIGHVAIYNERGFGYVDELEEKIHDFAESAWIEINDENPDYENPEVVKEIADLCKVVDVTEDVHPDDVPWEIVEDARRENFYF